MDLTVETYELLCIPDVLGKAKDKDKDISNIPFSSIQLNDKSCIST